MPNIGDPAPEFALKDQDQKDVKLSDFRGKKVLLSFFPFAFSPVCTVEFGCFEDDEEKFGGKNVEVIGISIDSHWTQRAFADKLGVHMPLLSDFDKKVCAAYGTLRADGFSDRAYFLVDENGIVRFKHVMDAPGKRLENGELLGAISGKATA